jgi:hypothetical protein
MDETISSALQVLDWLMRGVGLLIVMAAFILLIVFLWELLWVVPEIPLQPKPEPEHLASVTPIKPEPIKPKIVAIYTGMGLQGRFDYAEFGGTLADRLGHCYMLAAKAALWSRDSVNGYMPEPVAIIHGSMHGPDAAERIGHAIVLLDDGRVWEPVTQGIYDRTQFESYSRWERHHIHSISETRHWMQSTGNYGPWIGMS